MNDLLKELIYEIILSERKNNKPAKNIIKGKSYKCVVKKTVSKNFKKTIKNKHKNKKTVLVKVVEPDGRGDYSIIKFNKKNYMVKTNSLKVIK